MKLTALTQSLTHNLSKLTLVAVLGLVFLSLLLGTTLAYGYSYGYGYGDQDKTDPVISFNYTHKTSSSPIAVEVLVTDETKIASKKTELGKDTTATVENFTCEKINSREVKCTLVITASGTLHIVAYDKAGNRENHKEKDFVITGDVETATCNAKTNGQALEEKPTQSLCTIGNPSDQIEGDGSEANPWKWHCYNSLGEKGQQCNATKKAQTPAVEVTPISQNTTSLFRFWSPTYNGHFYTAFASERDAVKSNPNWNYEGVAYQVSLVPTNVFSAAVYRFWSPVYKHHFYTTSVQERNATMQDANWNYEGVAYFVKPLSGDSSELAVYRFWSPVYKGHFYTASKEETKVLESNPNWTFEGKAWAATGL